MNPINPRKWFWLDFFYNSLLASDHVVYPFRPINHITNVEEVVYV